ncbi:LacI family DNA-binding transcriptional regulator [Cerasicoccus frondis]|uniref:LacI family DNA-binding transcriptional regulator n=1 Tax=Cerasicoccus frondis TaxID=490090 RepID=UPI0028526AFE|nr:LacI family DNA-binding transcriptional regulator [Cerasicoccus frondis]
MPNNPPDSTKIRRQSNVTLKDIAQEAGVTTALVSMALRNSPKVAAKTRDRIQALSVKMGYQSNPMVRTLMSQVRQQRKISYRETIGFITNLESATCWHEGGVYVEYFYGAQKRAHELGYELEHFWMGEYRPNYNRLANILRNRGIQGLLIPPLPEEDHHFDMDLKGFSAVAFGYSLEHPGIYRFCNNHVQTIQTAIDKLIELGYKHIGICLSKLEIQQVNHLWWAGLSISRYRHPKIKFSIYSDTTLTKPKFQKWFKKAKPEVVIGLRKHVHAWLKETDKNIPDDVGFLHLDCVRSNHISGMFQNTEQLGEAAIEYLCSLLEGRMSASDSQSKITLINSVFHEGDTLQKRSS